jgi:DNA-binding transcriptional LysR family regulator
VDLDDLRCFLAAVDAPTFRAASRRVALSPGAFSDRLRRLEDDLGVELFHRTSRSRRTSDAGRRLEPAARALLADAQRCVAAARGADRPPDWSMTLGTRYELGLSWLAPMLEHLDAHQPERTVHLYAGDTPDLLRRLEAGDLDAVVFSARLTRPHLEYATLHPEAYVFVGAPGAQLTHRGEASAHTLVDVSPDLPLFRYLLDAMPTGDPWSFAGHRYLGGIGGVRLQVLRGAGVAVLPEYFVRADLQAGALVRLMPDQPLLDDAFRLVWRAAHPWAERFAALAEELRARPIT